MRKVLVAFTIGILTAATALAAKGKDRFVVIAPHTAEQCLAVLDDINEHDAGLFKKIDWGCAAAPPKPPSTSSSKPAPDRDPGTPYATPHAKSDPLRRSWHGELRMVSPDLRRE
jgi:hypothetical protein